MTAAGHNLASRVLLKDDLYKIRAQVANWIADDVVQVVLITGGTGFTGRDSTPEAVSCLLDKQVGGFGELFRQISVADIGTSIFSPAPWPVWRTGRWSAACQARPMRCARVGMAFFPNNWTRAIAPVISWLI